MSRFFGIVLGLLSASAAAAESVESVLLESPRHVTIELKLGSFFPLIDDEQALNGATPYADTFGQNAAMLRFELAVQAFIYQGWGSLSAGVGFGYAEKFAAASTASGSVSQEKTGIRFYPLSAMVEYRFDYAAFHWKVPLVPYGKVALIYMPWQSVTGSSVETSGALVGQGGKWGYGLTAGLSLLLDVLEPRFARELDSTTGINHTYFFAEYTYEQVDDFGAGGLNLSSKRFMFGLALDF